ncbi:MAG TPA: hypothetical protein VE991_09100 [Acidimicrobiales bacterium]|nr:hypothetical protein [Acidimicrobiales bacterium]
MHAFALFLFFSFGVMAMTMLGERYLHHDRERWVFVACAFGIGLAWLADLNMWTAWGIHLRYDWVGVTMTGLAMGGAATFVHSVTEFFSGLHRKFHDQAEVMEQHELRRAA